MGTFSFYKTSSWNIDEVGVENNIREESKRQSRRKLKLGCSLKREWNGMVCILRLKFIKKPVLISDIHHKISQRITMNQTWNKLKAF